MRILSQNTQVSLAFSSLLLLIVTQQGCGVFVSIQPCKFAQVQKDFGNVAVGDRLSHEFEFQNTGTSILQLKRILTGCGCIAHKTEKQFYQPGEKGTVTIALNTTGLKSPKSIIQTVVCEYLADGKIARVPLKLTCQLSPDIQVEPETIKLVSSPGSDVYSSTFTVRREMLDVASFRELILQQEYPGLTIRESYRNDNKLSAEISIDRFVAMSRPQTIALNYDRNGVRYKKRIRVELSQTHEPASLKPSSVFAMISSGTPSENLADRSKQEIQLKSNGHRDFSITKVSPLRSGQKTSLKWEISKKSPDLLTVWVESMPEESGFAREELVVTYENDRGQPVGQCLLPVYVVHHSNPTLATTASISPLSFRPFQNNFSFKEE